MNSEVGYLLIEVLEVEQEETAIEGAFDADNTIEAIMWMKAKIRANLDWQNKLKNFIENTELVF